MFTVNFYTRKEELGDNVLFVRFIAGQYPDHYEETVLRR